MARGAYGTIRPIPEYPPVEGDGATPAWRQFLTPPGGLDQYTRQHSLKANVSPLVTNLVPGPDGWRMRLGSALVGGTHTASILYAASFEDSTGTPYLFRWTRTGVDVLDGATWVALAGPTLTASTEDRIASTAWGNLLIFSNGVDGMHVITPSTRTFASISGAPNASHLATFNRRVIASVPSSGRVQWCIAGDYSDWTTTNLGAGYEDLLSTEAGSSERQTACIPVTDEVAYLIRSRSVWQMEVTRQSAAPFAFTRTDRIGSRWSQACCAIPGGAAFMADDGVFLIRGGPAQKISQPLQNIFADMAATTGNLSSHAGNSTNLRVLRLSCMIYSQRDRDIRLSLPIDYAREGTMTAEVFRYSLDYNIWSNDSYNFPIRALSSTPYRKILTIGELTGTIGALTGTVGELGVSEFQSGMLMISNDNSALPTTHFIAREAADVIKTTASQDVQAAGTSAAMSCVIYTPPITAGDPRRLAHLHELTLILEHDTPTSGTGTGLLVAVISNDGTTLTPFNTTLPTISGGYPVQLRLPCNMTGKYVNVALSATRPVNFRLLDVLARVTDGAWIGDLPA